MRSDNAFKREENGNAFFVVRDVMFHWQSLLVDWLVLKICLFVFDMISIKIKVLFLYGF